MAESLRDKFRSHPLAVAAALLLGGGGLYGGWFLTLQGEAGRFAKYPAAAARLMAGTLPPERLPDFSPIYLWLCVLTGQLDPTYHLLAWVQAGLVGATAAAIFLLLRSRVGDGFAFGGAVALLLSPGIIIYAGLFEPEPLMVALLVLLVLCASVSGRGGWFGAGVVLTVCLLTRPSFLLLALLLPGYFWLTVPPRQRRQAVGLFLAPVVAGLVLFAVAYPAVFATFPPPLMNPGTVFFEGNNPLTNGTTAAYPPLTVELTGEFPEEVDYDHAVYRLLARREYPERELTPGASNRVWSGRALAFIVDEPGHFLGNLGRKLLYAFHNYRWHDFKEAHLADRELRGRSIPLVPLALVATLALYGVLVGLRHWRELFPCYAVLSCQLAVMLTTYASERQRLALLPFLIIFAVIGLDWLWKRRGRQLMVLIPLPLLVAGLSHETDRMRDDRHNWDNYALQEQLQAESYRLRNELRFDAAATALARCYAAAPWMAPMGIRPMAVPLAPEGLARLALHEFAGMRGNDPTARLDRVLLLIDAGELVAAEGELRALLVEGAEFCRILNRPARPEYYLGRIAAMKGERSQAIAAMKQALDEAPGDPAILAQLAMLTNEERYAESLERYFGRLNALNAMASAALENGQAQRAAGLLRELGERLPEYWKGQLLLAAALADSGQDAAATAIYLQAMQKRQEPLFLAERVLPAFRRVAMNLPLDEVARFWYAKALLQQGFFEEARAELLHSLALRERPEVRRELAGLEDNLRRAQSVAGQ